jgi:hypothetical protein
MYIHVCTMFRHVCTVLPFLVQVVRIPDGLACNLSCLGAKLERNANCVA